jgi:hypothetical protein
MASEHNGEPPGGNGEQSADPENPQPKKKRGGVRPGAGGPRFAPSNQHRYLVELMAGFGLAQDRIRLAIINPATKKPVSVEVFVREFQDELETGGSKIDAIVARSMAVQLQNGNMTALIWFSKNRWGWRDHYDVDHRVNRPEDGPVENGMIITIRGGLPPPPADVAGPVIEGEVEKPDGSGDAEPGGD